MSVDQQDRPVKHVEITDMAEPVLTELQKQTVANAPKNPMDSERVLELARQATGLSDFGDDDFRPRLDLWLECAEEDRTLTQYGRNVIFNLAVRYAANRLRVEDLVKRHPEILDIKIDRPIVIAGLPKSGTTHLQNFLAADPRLRNLPYWEALWPVPAPEQAPRPDGSQPRREACAAGWEQEQKFLPLSAALHEFSPDHTSEDIELSCIDFGSYHIEWHIFAYKWREYCLTHDQTPVYRYLKKCLQVLDFITEPTGPGRPKERWVMKCPQHMEYLIPLTTVFPDATVVITHRDPVGSIQSALSGNGYRQRVKRTGFQREETLEYFITLYERLLKACVRDRPKLDDAKTQDVFFHAFMAEPMKVLEEIYAKAGMSLDENTRQRMSVFLEENPRGKHGQVVHQLKRNYGAEPEEVRNRFKFYFDAFPQVKVEVK